MGRKRKNNYFTEETEQAVRDYILSNDYGEKNRIFSKHLYIPIRKICEVYANTSQLGYVHDDKEDLINDCMAHLVDYCFRNFKPDGNTKAYSYFSVSAKYWFMQKNMKGYTQLKRAFLPIDDTFDAVDEYHNKVEYDKHFLKKYYAFIDWYEQQLPNFGYTKKMLVNISNVIQLLKEFDEVTDFFKKEVNAILKEMGIKGGVTQSRFARIHVYHQYLHFSKCYDEGDFNPKPSTRLSSDSRSLAFNKITKKTKLYNTSANKTYKRYLTK